MPDSVWTPSLDDTELDELSSRLRVAVRSVVPELLGADRGNRSADQSRRVEVELAPGMTLHLEVTRMRSVVRANRPELEAWLHGTVRSLDPRTGRAVDMPISGECRLDLDSRAIVHLIL